jgi:hypothetical protein
VRSSEPEARSVPSGEKDTLFTEPVWPSSVNNIVPSLTCHNRTVPSVELEAKSEPSGEKATSVTLSIWPSRMRRSWTFEIMDSEMVTDVGVVVGAAGDVTVGSGGEVCVGS